MSFEEWLMMKASDPDQDDFEENRFEEDSVCYCGDEITEDGTCAGCGEDPEDCECNLEAE